MQPWICVSFVVKESWNECLHFESKQQKRQSGAHGWVICDYADWLASFFCHMDTLQSGQTAPKRETSKEGKLDYTAAVEIFFFSKKYW